MSKGKEKRPAVSEERAERRRRLSDALRENLKRRKMQARARDSNGPADGSGRAR